MLRIHGKMLRIGLMAMLVAGAGAACERAPEDDDRAEVDRELELALEDTAAAEELRDAPAAEEPARQPQAQRPPAAQQPRTQPPAQQPRAEQPRAQPPAEQRPREPEMMAVTAPAGASFRVVLNQELSTRASQPGDLFTARVADAVTDGRRVVIPSGATVRGQVTAVQKSGSRGQEAVLTIDFSEVSFDGATYPLRASVVEANPETRSRTSGGERAAKIGGGAAAGAILGRIIGGDVKGAVIGGVVGAAAGTAIVMGTEDVDAVLPAGSEMTIRLDEAVVVQQRSS